MGNHTALDAPSDRIDALLGGAPLPSYPWHRTRQNVRALLEQLDSAVAERDTALGQVESLTETLTADRDQLAQAQAAEATLTSTVATQTAEITSLQAQIAALQHPAPSPTPSPKPSPTPRKLPLIGAYTQPRPGETIQAANARYAKTCGKPQVIRQYHPSLMTQAIKNALAARDGANIDNDPNYLPTLFISAVVTTPVKGVTDDQTEAYKLANEYGGIVLMAWDFEAKHKVSLGQMTLAGFKVVWADLADDHKTLAGPRVLLCQVFTDADYGELHDYYVGDSLCDVVGVDPYVKRAGELWSDLLGDVATRIRSVTTKPIYVGELGDWVKNGEPPSVAQVQSLGKVDPTVYGGICLFDSLKGTAYDALPDVAAAVKALTA